GGQGGSGGQATTGGGSGTAGQGGSAGSGGGTDASDDGPPQVCSSFGDVRQVPCGNCGKRTETCTQSGYWSAVGGCEGEGECSAGGTEQRNAETCSADQRTCDTGCHWGTWIPVVTDPCTPGTED